MKNPCWKGYQAVGMKMKGGKKVPNCVPIEEALTPQGRLKKRLAMRKNRYKLNRRKNIALNITASKRRLERRALLAAQREVYRKLTKTKNKSKLSYAQRAVIEKILKNRGKYYTPSLVIKKRPILRRLDVSRRVARVKA